MRHCMFCGAVMEAGNLFCCNCGKRQEPAPAPVAAAAAPAPAFAPPAPAFAPAPPLPAAVPAAPQFAPGPYGTAFEVIKAELFQMPKITLQNSAVTIEGGQLHYMIGAIQMTANMPGLGGLAKAMLTQEKAVRPVYQGTGEIYLTPTFGECNILEVNSEEWVLDKGAYLASDQGIAVGAFTNKAMTSLFGGEGIFQTKISGHGKLLYWSQGPVQRLDLRGQTLVVDGSFAVARTAALEYRVERATKGMWGSMISGEGLVNTFQGFGTVMLAPVPNRYMAVQHEFGGLYSAIRSIKR